MALRYYAYGVAAAAIMTGGVALFYDPAPDLQPRADTWVELFEGYNERLAALATKGHTRGVQTNTWNLQAANSYLPSTGFTNVWMSVSAKQVDGLMQGIISNAHHWVRYVTPTSITMHTAGTLFQDAAVGPADGSQALYTIAVTTNGLPIYSNHPAMTIPTNLQWECYRLERAMTQTVGEASWGVGKIWSYVYTNEPPYVDPVFWGALGGSNFTEFYFAEDTPVPRYPDYHPWVTWNNTNTDYMWQAPERQAEFEDAMKTRAHAHHLWDLPPSAAGPNFAGSEWLEFGPRLPYMVAVKLTEYPDPVTYSFYLTVYGGSGYGLRFVPPVIIPLYHMAAGVTSHVSQPIGFTGYVSSAYAAFATNDFSYVTNVEWTVAYTGMDTGLFRNCTFTTEVIQIQDVVDLDSFVSITGDTIRADALFYRLRDPVKTWTFTRCRP